MPLGTKVGLGPHCGTWGPSSPPKWGTASDFRPMSIVAKRSPISATAEHLWDMVSAITVFICDTPVHKGQRSVTMATNFATKFATNAFLWEITRMCYLITRGFRGRPIQRRHSYCQGLRDVAIQPNFGQNRHRSHKNGHNFSCMETALGR